MKVGDRWYQYGRLEPLATVLGLAADYAEIAREESTEDLGKLAAHIGESVAQNLTSKTFLSGATALINALDDPQRYGEQYLKNFLGPVVPTLGAQVARAIDPTVRRTGNVLEAVQVRVTGASERLLPRLDLLGREIKRPMSGAAALSPIQVSKESDDEVDKEFIRLGVSVRVPDRKIEGVRLSDAQHNEFIRIAGQGAKGSLR